MNEFHYFSSPVYREELPDWVDLVSGGMQKHFNSTQAYLSENDESYPVLQTANAIDDCDLTFIKNYFHSKAVEILKAQGFLLDDFEFYVSEMWGQQITKFGFHEPHVHPNTQICGLYFLSTPPKGSFPIFSDPRPGKLMCNYQTPDDKNIYIGTPKIFFENVMPGTFMLFNAWLPHQLAISQTVEPTKFVHFMLSHKLKGFTCSTC
jgi:uncharacterized protein (TIGR02466 family)